MRVERTFSPKKLILESEDDIIFFMDVIKFAMRSYDRPFFGRESNFIKKLMYLERELK